MSWTKKRGQLSLEMMIMMAVLTACLVIVSFSVMKMKDSAFISLKKMNAKNILDSTYYYCEKSAITNEKQIFKVNAIDNFVLHSNYNKIIIESPEFSLEKKIDFNCVLYHEIKEGKNNLSILSF